MQNNAFAVCNVRVELPEAPKVRKEGLNLAIATAVFALQGLRVTSPRGSGKRNNCVQ